MDKSKDYIEIKKIERFRYLKSMVQNEQEIHSAITVMQNLRKDKCISVCLSNETTKELGVSKVYTVGYLLALFKEYLEEREVNKDKND